MKQQGNLGVGAAMKIDLAAAINGTQSTRLSNGMGSNVTLADGSTAKATYVSTLNEVQKYVPPDGELMGRGKVVVVFVFDGAHFNAVKGGDKLTFMGTKYTAQGPFHPNFLDGQCVSFAVPAYIP